MHDGRSRDDVMQPRRQRGLATGTAPVHGQDYRAAYAFTAPGQQRSGRDGRKSLRTPWPGFGLPGSKTQGHGDKCYPGRPVQYRDAGGGISSRPRPPSAATEIYDAKLEPPLRAAARAVSRSDVRQPVSWGGD